MNRDRILEILFPRQQDGHSNVVESTSTTTRDESSLEMKKVSTKETCAGCQDRDNTATSSKGTECAICIESIGKLMDLECTLVWKYYWFVNIIHSG